MDKFGCLYNTYLYKKLSCEDEALIVVRGTQPFLKMAYFLVFLSAVIHKRQLLFTVLHSKSQFMCRIVTHILPMVV